MQQHKLPECLSISPRSGESACSVRPALPLKEKKSVLSRVLLYDCFLINLQTKEHHASDRQTNMEKNFSLDRTGSVVKITLIDRIDSVTAPALFEAMQTLTGEGITRIMFVAKDLQYISSAGLRAIVFAKQKIGKEGSIFLVGAPKAVIEVFEMTGFHRFITIQDDYPD